MQDPRMPHAFPVVPGRTAAAVGTPPPCDMAAAIALRLRGRGMDVIDLQSEALLAWAECSRRHSPAWGATLRTHAFPAMYGRPRDRLRGELRYRRAVRQLGETSPESAPPCSTGELAVRAALRQVEPELKTAERVVLREVYYADQSLRQASEHSGLGEDTLWRAHQRLLQRLRPRLADVQPA